MSYFFDSSYFWATFLFETNFSILIFTLFYYTICKYSFKEQRLSSLENSLSGEN